MSGRTIKDLERELAAQAVQIAQMQDAIVTKVAEAFSARLDHLERRMRAFEETTNLLARNMTAAAPAINVTIQEGATVTIGAAR